MTETEATMILAVLKTAYPRDYNYPTREEAHGAAVIWATQFADMPAEIILMAVNKLISSSRFAPSIAEIKSKVETIHWEAYEMLAANDRREISLPPDALNHYQQIYATTKQHKYSKAIEPHISQMIQGGELKKLLNGG